MPPSSILSMAVKPSSKRGPVAAADSNACSAVIHAAFLRASSSCLAISSSSGGSSGSIFGSPTSHVLAGIEPRLHHFDLFWISVLDEVRRRLSLEPVALLGCRRRQAARVSFSCGVEYELGGVDAEEGGELQGDHGFSPRSDRRAAA